MAQQGGEASDGKRVVAAAAAAPPAVTGAQVFEGGQGAAKDYGKGGQPKCLPDAHDLLCLKPEDQKAVKAIVDAIQFGPHSKLGDALKQFEGNPKHLDQLKDYIQLELEKRKLSGKYSIDIMPYDDRPHANITSPEQMDQRTLVVTDQKTHKDYAYGIDGKPTPERLLKFLYD